MWLVRGERQHDEVRVEAVDHVAGVGVPSRSERREGEGEGWDGRGTRLWVGGEAEDRNSWERSGDVQQHRRGNHYEDLESVEGNAHQGQAVGIMKFMGGGMRSGGGGVHCLHTHLPLCCLM